MFAVLPCVHADDLSDDTLDVLYEDVGVDGNDSFVTSVTMLKDVIESAADDDDDDSDYHVDGDREEHVLKPYIDEILDLPDNTMILIYVSMDKIKVVDKPLPAEYTLD